MYMRIRKAREELGYTREKFAEKLDVSVSYLAELERGRTGISVKMLRSVKFSACRRIMSCSVMTGRKIPNGSTPFAGLMKNICPFWIK